MMYVICNRCIAVSVCVSVCVCTERDSHCIPEEPCRELMKCVHCCGTIE